MPPSSTSQPSSSAPTPTLEATNPGGSGTSVPSRRKVRVPEWNTIKERNAGLLFVAPVIILFLVMRVIPAFVAFVLGFTDYDLISDPEWVGFDNYEAIFTDPLVLNSFQVTAVYTVATVVPSVILSLLIALLLDKRARGVAIFRVSIFSPQVISWVAVSMVWIYMMNPGFGVINYVLRFFGVEQIPWLSSTDWALPSLILIGIWRNIGYGVIIYLAGLQGIPKQLYEAAMVDGARPVTRFRKITLPMLVPTTTFLLMMMGIISMQTFDQVFVLTGGGPANVTSTVVYFIYKNAFVYLNMGYASALAVVLFIVLLILSYVSLRTSGQLKAKDQV